MKNKKTLYSVIILLVVAAAITAGVIWFRNRKTDGTPAGATDDIPSTGGTSTTNSGGSASGSSSDSSPVPNINGYDWWIQKLGYAGFPLKNGSRGVEVVIVQDTLNFKTMASGWGLDNITVDGIWGPETESRFKLFFPGETEISRNEFKSEFDVINALNL